MVNWKPTVLTLDIDFKVRYWIGKISESGCWLFQVWASCSFIPWIQVIFLFLFFQILLLFVRVCFCSFLYRSVDSRVVHGQLFGWIGVVVNVEMKMENIVDSIGFPSYKRTHFDVQIQVSDDFNARLSHSVILPRTVGKGRP